MSDTTQEDKSDPMARVKEAAKTAHDSCHMSPGPHNICQPHHRDMDAIVSAAERAVEAAKLGHCTHGWRGLPPERGERIVTPCPACGGQLFIGDGGYLTCASVPKNQFQGCPCPSLSDAIRQKEEAARRAAFEEAANLIAIEAASLTELQKKLGPLSPIEVQNVRRWQDNLVAELREMGRKM